MPLSASHRDGGAGVVIADDLDLAWELAPAQPLVFAVESNPSTAEMILSIASGAQVQCEIFEDCASLVDGLSHSTPDLLLLDVTTEGTTAVEVLHALSQRAYPGVLQLMSEPGVSMVQPVRQLAHLHSLQVSPPLEKPIDQPTLRSMLESLRPTVSQAKPPQIRLDDAIANGWIRFWYQPKIDLRHKSLVGVEALVRLFHPHKGLMSPSAILKDAGEEDLARLLHYALVETGMVCARLSELGLKLTISINSTLEVLQALLTAPSNRDYLRDAGRQRNVLFDVSEDNIAKSLPAIRTIGPLLRSAGLKLAIDNFSGRMLPRAVLDDLLIAEIKLSPTYVAHCHTKSGHADVCKALIDLAHDLRCAAVAIGVETSAQSEALRRMGCDVGQGFLYGHPLPLEQLIVMIQQRSTKHRSKAAPPES